MKYFFLIITALYIWGCSSSLETANLTPQERLAYAMRLFDDEDYEEAVSEFQSIILQYPGNDVVDNAQFYLAETRYKRGEYIIAAYEFSNLIKNMPASEFIPKAQFMLAECYYEVSPNYTLDQRYTKKAIEEYQAFIDFFPTDEKVPDAEKKIAELNDKLAHKEFEIANIYKKMEYYKAALRYYDNVLDVYHDSQYAATAMYYKILLLIDRNRNSEALAEISKFLQKYPDNSNTKEVQELKLSLENKLSAAQ